MKDNSIKDKIALITGGGQGLGATIGKRLAKDGATVILGDIQSEKVKTVAEEIITSGGKAEGMTLDVTKVESIDQVVDKIIKKYGRIDILINNAGLDYTKAIEDFTVEEFDRELEVNLRGPFLLCRKIVPFMYEKKSGHIINIGSTAAITAWEFTTAYHTTKWGLRGLSYGLYTEAKWHNVKVTFLIPGGMNTAHNLERGEKGADWSWLQPPENVAETIAFILTLPGVTTVPELMITPIADWSLFPKSDRIEKHLYQGGTLPGKEKKK